MNDWKRVFLKEDGDTIFVRYYRRKKYERWDAAGFYAKDNTLAQVQEWVRKQPNLLLVDEKTGDAV